MKASQAFQRPPIGEGGTLFLKACVDAVFEPWFLEQQLSVLSERDLESLLLQLIDPSHSLYSGELELRFRVLREPLGQSRAQVLFPFEKESLHLVAVRENEVVGCLVFHPESDVEGRLLQMAVQPSLQGQGVGRSLMQHMEQVLHERGYRNLHLHARQTAVPFYAGLGYSPEGPPYTEVGIPHLNMRKLLAADLA